MIHEQLAFIFEPLSHVLNFGHLCRSPIVFLCVDDAAVQQIGIRTKRPTASLLAELSACKSVYFLFFRQLKVSGLDTRAPYV